MAHRPINDREIRIARPVYRFTLPYDRILIADSLGAGEAQYTFRRIARYVVHMGPEAFALNYSPDLESTLIHELAHVWQGHHAVIPWGYMVESLACQGVAIGAAIVKRKKLRGARDAAYFFKRDPSRPEAVMKPFQDYNPEQQALLIQLWFDEGMADDDLFPYIQCNIWRGRARGFRSYRDMVEWQRRNPDTAPGDDPV
jgi:hypothetical protein